MLTVATPFPVSGFGVFFYLMQEGCSQTTFIHKLRKSLCVFNAFKTVLPLEMLGLTIFAMLY